MEDRLLSCCVTEKSNFVFLLYLCILFTLDFGTRPLKNRPVKELTIILFIYNIIINLKGPIILLTVILAQNENTQTYISWALTSGELVCKPDKLIATRWRKLPEFERGITLDTRRMGHSIYEILRIFDIFRLTVSRMYRENLMEGITARPQVVNDRNQRHPARIIYNNGQAIMVEIMSTFNAGNQFSVL